MNIKIIVFEINFLYTLYHLNQSYKTLKCLFLYKIKIPGANQLNQINMMNIQLTAYKNITTFNHFYSRF